MPEKVFYERVLPNPYSLIWTLLVPLSFYLVFLPINEFAGLVLGIVLFLAVLSSIWFAAPQIEVAESRLTVNNATIDLRYVSKVEVISEKDAFQERGARLSPAAYVRFQPTVKGLVKVYLNDPADPTPYWLFASRKGDELKKLLAK
ncbi:MAG: DUF3093 domain-containing protein [Micrococcales bacterium]